MSIVKTKNVSFVNLNLDGYCEKLITEPTNEDAMVGYIGEYQFVDEVDGKILKVNDALIGRFVNTNSGWIGNDILNAKLTTSTIDFYEEDETTLILSESLQDFLELLQAWKTFLQTAPFQNQKMSFMAYSLRYYQSILMFCRTYKSKYLTDDFKSSNTFTKLQTW